MRWSDDPSILEGKLQLVGFEKPIKICITDNHFIIKQFLHTRGPVVISSFGCWNSVALQILLTNLKLAAN